MLTTKVGTSVSIMLVALILLFPNNANAVEIERVSGEDRIETAVEASLKGWPNGSETIVIARAYEFPDALAATPFAYQNDAPILLTKTKKLPHATKEEIKRLNANKIYLIGGKAAVSADVEAELKDMNIDVKRVAGENRYETAAIIAGKLGVSDQAVVVNGETFPDALSISAYASKRGYPIVLSTDSYLPQVTENIVDSKSKNYIIGGTAVIDETVEEDVPNATRIAGEDRFETSREVAEAFPMGDPDEAYLATGYDFADALTGSVLAAKTNDSLLLIEREYVPNPAKLFIDEQELSTFTVLGGYSAIDQYVDTGLESPIQLLLVNKKRDIPADFVPEQLVEPDVPFPFNYDHNKRYMNNIAVPHLENLFDRAGQAGLDLYAQSGYRSYERQKRIYERNVDEHGKEYANRVSAKPGHSEHQTGLAMDVTSPDVDYRLVEEFAYTDEGEWLARNAYKHGFVIRYPQGEENVTGYAYEPWHLRYVGENVARYMYSTDRVLEEYLR